MSDVTAWPTGQHEWYADEVASALAGLVIRDAAGNVRSGVISPRTQLVSRRTDMNLGVEPLLVVRARGRQALLGGVDSPMQVSVAPGHSASTRIDVVYALPRDPVLGESEGTVFVAQGIPSAAPARPSIPDEAVELAVLTVPAGATSTNACTLSETFPRTCAAGGTLVFRTAAERDAWAGTEGQLGYVGETLYRRTGSVWKAVVPPPVRRGVVTGDSGVLSAIGSTSVYGSTFKVSVPAVAGPSTTMRVSALGVGTGFGSVSQVSAVPNSGKTEVALRFTQIGNGQRQNVLLLWEILPIES